MLTLNNLKKSYDQTSILNGISLSIETGEIVSILGPSGSGKTTLLNCILGITDIDSGSVVFNGQDVPEYPWRSADSISYFRTMPCFRI